MKRAACFLPVLAILSGCASLSTTLQGQEKALNAHLVSARGWENRAADSPEASARELSLLLERAPADQPLAAHRKGLESQLRGLARSEHAMLDEGSIAAFPHLYQRRLTLKLTCLRGLARAHIARGETEQVKPRLQQARRLLELAGEQGLSPVFIAERERELYGIELSLAQARKRRFSQSLARLAQASMADYLRSSKAAHAHFEEQALAEQMEKDMVEIDNYIEQVNIQRIELQNQRINAVSGALTSVSAAVNQYAVSQALQKSGGVVTPQIQQMQMNSMLVEFQRKVLSMANESFAKGMSIGDSVLGSAGISNLAQQLADPSYGPNAADILAKFADEVASLKPGKEIKEQADLLEHRAQAVKAAQGQGDEQKTVEAAGQAMQTLLSLQGKLESTD